jgi:hypothetical protein
MQRPYAAEACILEAHAGVSLFGIEQTGRAGDFSFASTMKITPGRNSRGGGGGKRV